MLRSGFFFACAGMLAMSMLATGVAIPTEQARAYTLISFSQPTGDMSLFAASIVETKRMAEGLYALSDIVTDDETLRAGITMPETIPLFALDEDALVSGGSGFSHLKPG